MIHIMSIGLAKKFSLPAGSDEKYTYHNCTNSYTYCNMTGHIYSNIESLDLWAKSEKIGYAEDL